MQDKQEPGIFKLLKKQKKIEKNELLKAKLFVVDICKCSLLFCLNKKNHFKSMYKMLINKKKKTNNKNNTNKLRSSSLKFLLLSIF